MNKFNSLLIVFFLLGITSIAYANFGSNTDLNDPYTEDIILTSVQDTIPSIKERKGDFITDPNTNPFDLKDPAAIKKSVEYDPELGMYIISEKIGEEYYRSPTYMTFEEYLEWSEKQQRQDYFDRLSGSSSVASGSSGLKDPIEDFDLKENLLDRLFGGNGIVITPQGSVDLTLGWDYRNTQNPTLPRRTQRQGGFDFDMGIQMNVTGKIGDKLQLGTNYNTQATFDFDNQMKLEYAGKEDEIVKKIEAGNVSLPLKSSLIQGSQSLFGLKTELQFGRLTVTGLLSQQKSRQNNLRIQGGSTVSDFEVPADRYDENKHFFLSHYNRDHFEESLQNLPQINSLFKVTRLEVWVTNNAGRQTERVRDIVAIADLGEGDNNKIANNNPLFQAPAVPVVRDIDGDALPHNEANPMLQIISNNTRDIDKVVTELQSTYGLEQTTDFEKIRARLLSPREYTFHPELGFISLNTILNPSDVVGVAVEFIYNGQPYKIGEFAADVSVDVETTDVIYVKMLKSTTQRNDIPMWDLMMKNVYSLGAYQVEQRDFRLDVVYDDPGKGLKRFISDPDLGTLSGVPLIQLFELDNLNVQNDPQPDGVFDFVPGLTILPQTGKVIFPVLEPFGSYLSNQIADPLVAEKYAYQALYDSTLIRAIEYAELNRFFIKGSYRSKSSSRISLGAFNIPRGSVQVTAGGKLLEENRDYEINYGTGELIILNDAYISTGVPINVSFEDNSLFSFQQKTMIGTRADYKISDDFNIGATWLRLSERPFTQKVNIGDDPIQNNIYGADIQFDREAPWLTRFLDKLPLLQTKEKSSISFQAEVAYLDPGHPKVIEQDESGVVLLDDFEGSSSSLDLRNPAINWVLASAPQNDQSNSNPDIPESQYVNDPRYGSNRAAMSWYQVDQSIEDIDPEDNFVRTVTLNEVFPNLSLSQTQPNNLRPLDITFDPTQRGPYNFDLPDGYSGVSAGLDFQGNLNNPETRWGGIMRSLTTTDFQQANIEFIEMWVMSPFADGNTTDPVETDNSELVINLGNISEDILRDSRGFYENSLPTPALNTRTDTTVWGRIPRNTPITRAFDNDEASRELQDVGLDGLDNEGERTVFEDYMNAIRSSSLEPRARARIEEDPSADDFAFYNDSEVYPSGTDVRVRYSRISNPQGNSGLPKNDEINAATTIPDTEDIFNDNTLSETESYYLYRIPIRRDASGTGIASDGRFITDEVEGVNGAKWYRIKIPIEQYQRRVGGIQDFRAIRFIRMYLKGFQKKVTLRFARFELVRNQWRRVTRNIVEGSNCDVSTFDVNDVNVEENSNRVPFNYVLPPGLQREQLVGTAFTNAFQNEQSLSMTVRNLCDNDAKGIFKTLNFDMRLYKKMKMFIHAESDLDLSPEDVSFFIRVGSDFEKNYYEYEIPLTMSDPNASTTDDDYRRVVWPLENELDLSLQALRELKLERNNASFPVNQFYQIEDLESAYGGKMGIVGNPNLGQTKTIMMGVKNNEGGATFIRTEVWLNELRLVGFDEKGGLAGLARMDLKLADFGNITLAGNYTGIGYGGLEQKLQQRQREEVIQVDAAAQLELGKLIPEKTGIKIPFYASYSNTTKSPQFDPYDLDVTLKDKLNSISDATVKDSIKQTAQDVTTIKTFNFTNVRKERTNNERTPMPWDISNFSFDYAYSNTENRSPLIRSDEQINHRGGLNYNFSTKGLPIYPFKNLIKKDKYLKFLSEFNFNPIPNSFSFSTELDKQAQVVTYRFAAPSNSTWYNNRFTWNRSYGLNWDLSKALKFRFNAYQNSLIDEVNQKTGLTPDGQTLAQTGFNTRKEYMWDNIKNFGRGRNYRHDLNLSFNVPLKNFFFLDWTTLKADYKADYAWTGASLEEYAQSLGNIIQNSQTRSLNGDLNFERLYNKSKYLKKINSKQRKKGKSKNKDIKPKNPPKENAEDVAKNEKDKKKKKDREPSIGERILIRPLMSLRKVRLSYSENFTSVLPGFGQSTNLLGLSSGFEAPGWEFVTGLQQADEDWLFNTVAQNGWMTPETFLLNQEVYKTYKRDLSGKATLEPFNDFRIDVELKQTRTQNDFAFFKHETADTTAFSYLSPREVGSYNITFLPIRTFFEDNIEVVFDRFLENRKIISQRLGVKNNINSSHQTDDGYIQGYGSQHQEVLIPAFISAYADIDPNQTKLNLFKYFPLPNWKISYNGLSKIPAMKNVFSQFTLNHSYKSTLTVNNYTSDLDFDRDDPLSLNNYNRAKNDYYSRLDIPAIVIAESLSPLIGIQATFKNDISLRLDWKKSRNLSFTTSDLQLAESKSEEYLIDVGYRMKNVYIPFLQFGSDKKKKKKKKEEEEDKKGGVSIDLGKNRGGEQQGNDLDFKFIFSLRDDITINHEIEGNVTIPTRGNKVIRISPLINYEVNRQLSLSLFYDYTRTIPAISTSPPTTTSSAGLKVRFSLN